MTPVLPTVDRALRSLNTVSGVSSRRGLEAALTSRVFDMLVAMGRQPDVLMQAVARPDAMFISTAIDTPPRADVSARTLRAQALLTPGGPMGITTVSAYPNGDSRLPVVVVRVSQFNAAPDLRVLGDVAHCEYVTVDGREHEDILLSEFYRGQIEISAWAVGEEDATILEDVLRTMKLQFDGAFRAVGLTEVSGGDGSGYDPDEKLSGRGVHHIPALTWSVLAELRATKRRRDVITRYTAEGSFQ